MSATTRVAIIFVMLLFLSGSTLVMGGATAWSEGGEPGVLAMIVFFPCSVFGEISVWITIIMNLLWLVGLALFLEWLSELLMPLKDTKPEKQQTEN